jgi:hypothetical protein
MAYLELMRDCISLMGHVSQSFFTSSSLPTFDPVHFYTGTRSTSDDHEQYEHNFLPVLAEFTWLHYILSVSLRPP